VQVAVDPHARGALVQVRAAPLLLVEVVVEEARRTPVERERRGRHLPELHAERGRIGGQELAEGGVEDSKDLLAAVVVAELRNRHDLRVRDDAGARLGGPTAAATQL
jgi:hypothetical protein